MERGALKETIVEEVFVVKSELVFRHKKERSRACVLGQSYSGNSPRLRVHFPDTILSTFKRRR